MRQQSEQHVGCKCGENSFYVPVLKSSIPTEIWARLNSYRGYQGSFNNMGIWLTAHLECSVSNSTMMFTFVLKWHFRGRNSQHYSLKHIGQS